MKYSGMIGLAQTIETSPGIWKDVITEFPCHGNITKNSLDNITQEALVTDVSINNVFNVLAHPTIFKNHTQLRYLTWYGIKYSIKSVVINPPRVSITIGGVYND